MKVYVVFDFPGIDPDSDDADQIISMLEHDLHRAVENEMGYMWYIDDAIED